MDEMNTPRRGNSHRFGRGARWTAALAAAVAITAAGLFGLSLAGGSGSGRSTALSTDAAISAAASGAGAGLGGPGPASGAGAASSFSAAAGPAGRAGRAGLAALAGGRRTAARACVESARRLRAAGHFRAARARFLACVRRFPRLRFLLRLRAVVRHAEHGQVTFRTKNGARTLVFERGVVQSASAGSVVVKAADGTTWTWALTGSTVVTSDGHKVPASTLTSGTKAVLVGLVSNGANDARRIFVLR
ncbi:MAG TPA: hypothetical protein VF843_06145 [Streptosporangiaceae bacterium]